MSITQLKIELLLIIIEYVCEENEGYSGSAFAFVNRGLSNYLFRRARRIIISTKHEKWKSNKKRAKLLGIIDDPDHQLLLKINDKALLHGSFCEIGNPCLLSEIGSFCWFCQFSYSSSSWNILSLLANSTPFKVKSFDLRDIPDLESFDVIPNHIRSIDFQDFTTLTGLGPEIIWNY